MSASPRQVASGQAFGKVILLGEHAVVYGSPAIALALTRGAEAEVRRSERTSLWLGSSEYRIGPAAMADSEPLPLRAFRALLEELDAPELEARAALAIPAGAGLGASAALGVALARAVSGLLGRATLEGRCAGSVARAALAWENVFHGNASGIDTAAAEHGGCLWFTRAAGAAPLAVGGSLRVAVASVEPGVSTRRMVEAVAERRRKDPSGTDRVMDSIQALVARAREVIAGRERAELGRMMTQNHELLVRLGVSTPGLNQACEWALRAGALGAKLTGAGGGGCVVALVDDATRAAVLDAWGERGLVCLEATAPEQGSA